MKALSYSPTSTEDNLNRAATRVILELTSADVQLTMRDISRALKLGQKADQELVRRRARYLLKRGYLSGDARQGYSITALGRQRLSDLQFRRLEQTGKWDRTWRIVIFDIPESSRPARDAIRRLVKQLGFFPLQQSVWIHPLPCLDQFTKIRAVYGVRDNLLLLEVKQFDGELKLLQHFRKIYPDL